MPADPETPPGPPAAESETAELLARRRPAPAPEFLSQMERHLLDLDPGWGPRPSRLVPIVGAYLGLCLVLLGLSLLIGVGAL